METTQKPLTPQRDRAAIHFAGRKKERKTSTISDAAWKMEKGVPKGEQAVEQLDFITG